ncbi:hypothetical protein V8C43DRAFT_73750 [Trichoderma afarasin]
MQPPTSSALFPPPSIKVSSTSVLRPVVSLLQSVVCILPISPSTIPTATLQALQFPPCRCVPVRSSFAPWPPRYSAPQGPCKLVLVVVVIAIPGKVVTEMGVGELAHARDPPDAMRARVACTLHSCLLTSPDPGHQCHLQSPDSYLSSPGTVGPELLRFSGPFFYWSITTPPLP